MAGAGARTERSLPPPPRVPALGSPSLRQARSARTVPVGLEQAATVSSAAWRTAGSARHHRLWPWSRGRSGAGEAAGTRGWSGGLGEDTVPLLRGRCAAPRRTAPPRASPLPGPPPDAWVLCCSVSEFAGVSAPRSRHRHAEKRRVGLLRGSGSLPPRRGASRVPLGPREGGVRGLRDKLGKQAKAFWLSSQSPKWGGRGQLWGVRAPLSWLAGGGSAWGVPRVSAPLSVSASRPAPGEAATSFAFQQSISAITFAPISAVRAPAPGRGSLLRWSWVLAAEAPVRSRTSPTPGFPAPVSPGGRVPVLWGLALVSRRI